MSQKKLKSLPVYTIVQDHLVASGFDGLYNVVDGCGCQVSDLSPASCMTEDCRAGHKVPCDPETCASDGKCEWHIGEK